MISSPSRSDAARDYANRCPDQEMDGSPPMAVLGDC